MSNTREELIHQVPEKVRPRFADIVAITDRYCQAYLTTEFRDLCRDMVVTLCRKGFPLSKGKAAGWAAGVVYLIGWVSFVASSRHAHHVKAEDMARAMGVHLNTLLNRAKVIRESLNLQRLDPRWATVEMLEELRAWRQE